MINTPEYTTGKINNRKMVLLLLAVLGLFAGISDGRYVYVSSSSGSDDSVGDANHPWKTFAKLQEESFNGGDVINLQV